MLNIITERPLNSKNCRNAKTRKSLKSKIAIATAAGTRCVLPDCENQKPWKFTESSNSMIAIITGRHLFGRAMARPAASRCDTLSNCYETAIVMITSRCHSGIARPLSTSTTLLARWFRPHEPISSFPKKNQIFQK